MRLWSLHPEYLDSKGLVALWREGLLAQKVLDGKTKGYKNHPQLDRFKKAKDPVRAISHYLHAIVDESDFRGYKFDRDKIIYSQSDVIIYEKFQSVTTGQIEFEFRHLLKKLSSRDSYKYLTLLSKSVSPKFYYFIIMHPSFYLVDGDKENWEK